MKNNFTFLLSLFSFILCNSQPLIDFSNEWRSAECCYNFASGSTECTSRVYYFDENETVINGKTYHELLHSGPGSIFPAPQYFREEGSKVYFIGDFWGIDLEFLAYDFSVTPGQTVIISEDERELIVNAVDSITLLNGEKRKRIELGLLAAPSIITYWIEGIGGVDAPFNPKHSFASDCAAFLSCFNNDSTPLYSTGNCVTAVPGLPEQQPAITLYPNPASEQITLEGILPEQIKTIRITDQLGRELTTVNNPVSPVILIKSLPPGVCYLGIETKEGRKLNRRFLIFKPM